MQNQKIWMVTGASQGLGLATVSYLLQNEQKVIATTRYKSKFPAELIKNINLEVLELDITNEEDVHHKVSDIVGRYGRIDVLVNNAGYGFLGAVEEASHLEIEQIMEVNVFSQLRMIRHILPHMRYVRSGHIFNLSSIAGFSAAPGFGIYNASKFAVEGFSEAMYYELVEIGVKVTIVEPGAFRTNFLDSSLAVASHIIDDYDNTAGNTKRQYIANNGKQPGNPEAAASAIFNVANMQNPPLRLLLGQDAYNRALRKIEICRDEFERMKGVTLSTNF